MLYGVPQYMWQVVASLYKEGLDVSYKKISAVGVSDVWPRGPLPLKSIPMPESGMRSRLIAKTVPTCEG